MPQMIDEVLEDLPGEGGDEFDPFDYSLPLLLRFRSREARDYFLGQLSDGWGENGVDLHWPGMAEGRPLENTAGPIIVQVMDCHTGEEVK